MSEIDPILTKMREICLSLPDIQGDAHMRPAAFSRWRQGEGSQGFPTKERQRQTLVAEGALRYARHAPGRSQRA